MDVLLLLVPVEKAEHFSVETEFIVRKGKPKVTRFSWRDEVHLLTTEQKRSSSMLRALLEKGRKLTFLASESLLPVLYPLQIPWPQRVCHLP